ncbi:MAG: hypothetical protein L3J83_02800 [Proteobacteria bacterium]|nr:hypothetical protein [Pseudomonadota bacterium]
MLQRLLDDLTTQSRSTNQEQIHRIVCKAIANYCLENNFKVSQFQNEFLRQVVAESKKNNPDFTNVRIAASTGINRRNIKKLLNGENIYKDCMKKDTVMKYVQSYCLKNNTRRIKKQGKFESFQSYCIVAANGTLTHSAIAAELISQGRIIDEGMYYRVFKNNRTIVRPS